MSDYLSPKHIFNEHKPHNNRRAYCHDYTLPGDYMITLKKAAACPVFSVLEGDPFSKTNPPRVRLLPPGQLIERVMKSFLRDNPLFDFRAYVIMPDHVHIYWRVKGRIPKKLGVYIGYFKGMCTGQWKNALSDLSHNASGSFESPQHHRSEELFFEGKFNDRIAFPGIEHRLKNYIHDNPRRRLIVLKSPRLFQRVNNVRIDDQVMDCYGNFQLLRAPFMSAALVSSRYTPEERAAKDREWEWVIQNRGVLVSPFISNAEKDLMRRCLEGGGSIIRIIPDGLPSRYKPAPAELPLFSEGRILHIGARRPSSHRLELKREKCLALNELARWITAHSSASMTLLGPR